MVIARRTPSDVGPSPSTAETSVLRTIGRPALIVLLAVLAGVSSWFVIPVMQTAADGTATRAEGWVDGLVPLVLAAITLGFSASCAKVSRAAAVFPLLPFGLTTVVWACASGFESGSDALFALCLLGMPVVALGGGLFSALAVSRQA